MTRSAPSGSLNKMLQVVDSNSQIARNTLWNLAGLGLPLLVALAATPFLIHSLGTDRFGILVLAWVLIGYFSIFDLGIGRALTQLVAQRIGAGRMAGVAGPAWTALILTFVLGVLGGVLLAVMTPWLVHNLLRVPTGLQQETVRAFDILALSIPIVISSAALRGILEATLRFGMVNAVRIPVGLLQYLGPLLVVLVSHSLIAIVTALAFLRLIAWLVQGWLCMKVLPDLRTAIKLESGAVTQLLRVGGWMTVSNLINPLLAYADRFMIGALVSVSAVTYYATPSELITRVMVIPVALTGVLFPTFASSYARDPLRAQGLFERGVHYVFLALLPIVLLTITLARGGLELWLGPDFASKSAIVLQVLAVGVLFNSLAQVPFAFLQGVGRPDLTAKLNAVETPLYFGLAIWLIRSYGIDGAALAWTLRVAVDAGALFILAQRVAGTLALRRSGMTAAIEASALLVIAAVVSTSVPISLLVAPLLMGAFAMLARENMSDHERALARRFLRRPLSLLAP